MDRRRLLRTLGAAWAATGIPVEALAALTGSAARRPAGHRAWFTPEQEAALDGMTEAILPATDTPGARDVDVVGFLDILASEWMRDDERRPLTRGVDRAVRLARQAGASDLRDETAWVPILRELEAEGEAARAEEPDAWTFFHRLRALTLAGYYTSEPGMTVELYYRPRPGRWMGCVPLDRVARPVEEGLPGGGP